MQPPLLSFSAISTFGPTRPPSSVDADVLNGCPLRAANRLQQPLIENKLRSLERVGGTDLMDLSTVMVGYGMTARGRGRGRCDLFRERRTRR